MSLIQNNKPSALAFQATHQIGGRDEKGKELGRLRT